LEELGRRISVREFEEWYVYMSREQLLPEGNRFRHGQLVAATYNGGDLRPSGGARKWEVKDFVDPDVWKASKPEMPQSLAKQVAMLNSWRN
jgi:hypothetical protein